VKVRFWPEAALQNLDKRGWSMTALDESRPSDSDSAVSVFERLLCPRKQPFG
jgi:hypothetical protein